MAGLPIFIRNVVYIPGWSLGLTGFLFLSYFLIEIGFLKIFYMFRNQRLTQEKLNYKM